MLHATRQTIRILFLVIGFVLFVVLTVISASTATSRQAVAGKPHLMPSGNVAMSDVLGSPTVSADSSLPTVAATAVVARTSNSTSQSVPAAATVAAEKNSQAIPASNHAKPVHRSKPAPGSDQDNDYQPLDQSD